MELREIPHPRSAEVQAIAAELDALCAGDSHWCRFLRGYMVHARTRLAWNCSVLDRLLGDDHSWLDIGSFGVEALRRLQRNPQAEIAAVSYEGMTLSLDEAGTIVMQEPAANEPSIRIGQADIELDALPYPDASFDVVTCFECIEHLRATPKPMLDEIRRVLKPSGLLLLTTPNIVGSRAMVRLLAGKHPQENPRYHRKPAYGIVHPREYSMRELVALLDARGLECTVQRTCYFRKPSPIDRLASLAAVLTRPLGGLALGLGRQPVQMGDNLFVAARRHDRALDDWPGLIFEPDPFA